MFQKFLRNPAAVFQKSPRNPTAVFQKIKAYIYILFKCGHSKAEASSGSGMDITPRQKEVCSLRLVYQWEGEGERGAAPPLPPRILASLLAWRACRRCAEYFPGALIIVYSQNRMHNYSALSLWGLALPTVQGNYSTTWSGVWLNVLSVAQCCGSRRWRSWGVRRKPSAHGSHSDLSCRPLRSGFYRYFPSLGHQNFFFNGEKWRKYFSMLIFRVTAICKKCATGDESWIRREV